jgi:hypothetical protein
VTSVYSQRLCLVAQLGAGDNDSFTVPQGVVCVVRDIDVVWNDTAAGLVYAAIESVDGVGPVHFFEHEFAGGLNQWMGWRGRQVLEAGDILLCSVSGQGSLVASGYLLSA